MIVIIVDVDPMEDDQSMCGKPVFGNLTRRHTEEELWAKR